MNSSFTTSLLPALTVRSRSKTIACWRLFSGENAQPEPGLPSMASVAGQPPCSISAFAAMTRKGSSVPFAVSSCSTTSLVTTFWSLAERPGPMLGRDLSLRMSRRIAAVACSKGSVRVRASVRACVPLTTMARSGRGVALAPLMDVMFVGRTRFQVPCALCASDHFWNAAVRFGSPECSSALRALRDASSLESSAF